MSLRAAAEQFHLRSVKTLQNWLGAEDPTKVRNEQLWQELDEQMESYKAWKSHFDALEQDYARSKNLFYTKRYNEMKIMVKRCVMHLKLDQQQEEQKKMLKRAISEPVQQSERRLARNFSLDSKTGQTQSVAALKKAESQKKRDQRRRRMRKEEIDRENLELERLISKCKARIVALKEQLAVLDSAYETTKHYTVFHRVRLLRAMVKNAIEHPAFKDSLQVTVSCDL